MATEWFVSFPDMIFMFLVILFEIHHSRREICKPIKNPCYPEINYDVTKKMKIPRVKHLYPLPLRYLCVYTLTLGPKDIPPTNYDFTLPMHRLASFRHWPKEHPVSPIMLVNNGFFFIDTHWPVRDDSVMCHACFVTLSGWRIEDNIYEVHRRSSPHCPFLAQLGEAANGVVHQDIASSSANIDQTGTLEIIAGGTSSNLSGNTSSIYPAPNQDSNTSLPPRNSEAVSLPDTDSELSSSIVIRIIHPQSPTPDEDIELSNQSSFPLMDDIDLSNSTADSQLINSNSATNMTLSNPPQAINAQAATQPRPEAEDVQRSEGNSRGVSTSQQLNAFSPQSVESAPLHNYSSIQVRRETFGYSGLSPDGIDALVEEGFYFTESGAIRCFYCHTTIQRWRSQPHAHLTHLHLNIDCGFIQHRESGT
ncbi:baculoviral IAP repeat-containing protein 3 [Biomphalaria glabrata]|nr:baculoviral IAP repeat-containing protein 3 [Biomphalaria glabrata]